MKQKRGIIAYSDGGARGNPGPGGAGWVIESVAENKRFLCGKYLGHVTNNQAEYAAVELALTTILENFEGENKAQFYLDSKLAVNQLNGLFKVKNPILREIILRIHLLESRVGEVYYQHIKREKNWEADQQVNKAIDTKTEFKIETKIEK